MAQSTSPTLCPPTLTTPTPDGYTATAQRQQHQHTIALRASLLLRTYGHHLPALLDWISQQGTPVYCFTTGVVAASAILKQLGYQPGFITPAPEAWRFNLLAEGLGKLIYSDTLTPAQMTQRIQRNGVWVLPQKHLSIGLVAYQLYHWLAYKHGLEGYSELAQRLFQTQWENNAGELNPDAVAELDLESILALQHAVQREAEALQFVRDYQRYALVPNQQAEAFKQCGRAMA